MGRILGCSQGEIQFCGKPVNEVGFLLLDYGCPMDTLDFLFYFKIGESSLQLKDIFNFSNYWAPVYGKHRHDATNHYDPSLTAWGTPK